MVKYKGKEHEIFSSTNQMREWRNKATSINVEGSHLTSLDKIKLVSFDHFEDLYKELEGGMQDEFDAFLRHIPNKIREERNATIMGPLRKS